MFNLLNLVFVLFLFRPLAQYDDFKRHKCIQTEPYRNAPIVIRRFKATQTDEPDLATFRKVVDSVTIEVQTDDVPELLRAAIEHAEKITQTQSKPLEISAEERFYQLVEYYRDVTVQTVESRFAPWTASHTIEEPPPKPKPRTPTPPPVVEIKPEEDEIEQLRAELNEDAVFDPLKFRKRMSLAGLSSKETEKKASKGDVDPKVEAKPTSAPSSAPVPPVNGTDNVIVSSAKLPTAVSVAQKQDAIDIDQLFEIVEEEPVFSSSQYKKKSSVLSKAENQPAPNTESKPSTKQPPAPEVQGQESVGVDQIFDVVEEEPVFDPSRYIKRMQLQSEAQTPVSESKPDVTQQSDHVETTKPPAEVQRQVSVGFDQIFDNVEEEPVFDPSRYLKRFSALPKTETQPLPPTEPEPTVNQQPPTEIQRQESVGFDQIFDNVEEPVFDPSRYLKSFSASAPSREQCQTPTKERSKTPGEASSTQPSLELNEPSVSSSVESSHKTNEELPPSSERDGYVTTGQTSDSSPPAPLGHLCPTQEQPRTFYSQTTQTDDGYSVPESGTNLSIPPPCGLDSEVELEVSCRASPGYLFCLLPILQFFCSQLNLFNSLPHFYFLLPQQFN